ncbi:HRDC domain-containing protein [Mucilaginibacter myungsuensis]|uniref:AAA family ATPase n=1 Tax=Mucilaginibacter myungsuensis TaxID=649104 RepID=A0A929KYY4_9SPHI|nr:HRDC domain-containing protein [Mucilaginibacter myungsuensis]MBE9663212.1 AAA family ATPase [Mucilaginibacter myungsuensis]MDN3598845.1 AAA family ATPase [Mucilaginibacter myungsuensis]
MTELAQAFIDTTNTLIFLTGKAGTGKTTFLRHVRQTTKKRMAIVAPTGVAAINAGGMTIHSLFQLPFGPLVPGNSPEIHYNPEKRDLLIGLELLVIDEISMVRPDVLDQLDTILRNLRGSKFAFGGVQLLLIGDLAQLSPIVRDEEWALLRPYYTTPYFFSSQVLQRTQYVRIELEKVYRQTDPVFVDILNAMREQRMTEELLSILNARYQPDFSPSDDEPYITLTTHNKLVQELNANRLSELDAEAVVYNALIRGEFPTDAYPTDSKLQLKVGAQVMFVKNDSSAEKRYYNGKIGTVTHLTSDTVTVSTGDGRELDVQALEWTNLKYELAGDDISEQNAGSFAQIPLKLAWAITIHKSQGLTFDRAIIDVSGSFAHGQAYVALSRCRSLEGLVLRKPVAVQNVIGDPAVRRFNEQANSHNITLQAAQNQYRLFTLSELFNFSGLKIRLQKIEHLLKIDDTIFAVAEKMQLAGYSPERIQKAAVYFHQQLEATIIILHGRLGDHVGKSKEMAGRADELLRWLMQRIQVLETFTREPFSIDLYQDLMRKKIALPNSFVKALNAKPNEELFDLMMNWRERTAQTEGILANMLFTEQTLAAIAAKLPATLKALSGIKGVGTEKVNRYGASILGMIRTYQGDDQASLF